MFCSSALKSIELHNNILQFGYGSFMYCNSLESIIIPENITILPKNIFSGCYNLKKIDFNNKKY